MPWAPRTNTDSSVDPPRSQAATAAAVHAAPGDRDQPGSWAYDGPGPCGAAVPHVSKLFISSRGSGRSNSEAHEQREHRKVQRRDVPSDGLSVTLEVFVTLPACRDRNADGDEGPPYPVLVFFNGFQVSSSLNFCLHQPPLSDGLVGRSFSGSERRTFAPAPAVSCLVARKWKHDRSLARHNSSRGSTLTTVTFRQSQQSCQRIVS